MKKKSIYTKEQLMQYDKEFLVETILRLEQDKNYWFEISQDARQEHQKTLRDFMDILNKK
tara:strand:+ start:874 stop:1053 length:180 start_codon:yes stop_codon:yes gene_type:complete